ncbi:MAG: hypothetical protein IJA45_02595 [Oscillospiraceae bacterium]|nr:hypothetical protein [Oscillospiraceae bacterium]
MKYKKSALFKSLISLLLCFSMLMGTTFAWFTDSVMTGINTIAAGNLDVELFHSNAAVSNEQVDSNTKLFMDLQGDPILWEPGVVSYENLRITNEGDLALAYQLAINTANENFVVDGSNLYGLSQVLKVGVVEGGITATDRAGVVASVEDANWTTLANFLRSGSLLPEGAGTSEETWGIVIYWEPGDNDNFWNLNNDKQLSEGDVLSIDLGIKLVASQDVYESDSLGNDYDSSASLMPTLAGTWTVSAPVIVENGVSAETVTIGGANARFTASVPAGVKIADGVEELSLTVSTTTEDKADVQLEVGQVGLSLDVHLEGTAGDNTVPIVINLGKIAPTGLYDGNIVLYHVENGKTIRMTQVADMDALDAHNEFYYNGLTGEVTLMMATFSTVYAAIDIGNPWNGTDVDTSWYSGDGPYTLDSAADLAGFAQLVAGGNTFAGKTVKLGANINMGGDAVLKDGKLCFHPIGVDVSGESDAISAFSGTFDGNNHTISNIYQNTWMLKGHYSEGYYNEAMGLFGLIDGGTVKNMVIDSMVCEGEFADMGCVTAYARGNCTFDNIRISNASMYSYNCRTAGIVGYDWIGETGSNLTFSNIEIDPTSTFGALWGSWDVACAGILGYKNDASKVTFTNCEVGCELDVFNDVCANYQYYDYRYAGMMIGTVGKDGDPSDQLTNGNITFNNCAVHYGDWVNHYHCELEANSPASYTEDYQMSRLDKIYSLSEIQNTDGSWKMAGNFVLLSGENKTCYHIVNNNGTLEKYDHTVEEDKQCVHTVFDQILTGYGWGATSTANGLYTTNVLYTITYINNGKVLDVTYVTDNSQAVSTTHTKAAEIAVAQMGSGYAFSHWMNAGSTKVENVADGNTQNVVLYPSFVGIYTATFVDLDGNILAWDTYTKNDYSSVQGKTVTAPAVADCEFDYWEVRVDKNGTVTKTKLSEYKFADNLDITIYPVYTYNGDVNLVPIDNDGDGVTDAYQVGGYSDPNGQNLVEIPDSVNGIKITSIAEKAFSGYDGVHAVVIPTTVTTVGSNVLAENWGFFDSGETVTIYYAGSYSDWVNKEAGFTDGWDNGLGTGSRIFFLNGNKQVDPSQGYLEYTHTGNGLWQSHSGSWSAPKAVTEALKTEYTGKCDCSTCKASNLDKPDKAYWDGITIS